MTAMEPKIVAFCCNWCSYAAADLAGTNRLQYPHNVRIIRVMCSGMVHPELILEALNLGASAAVVFGCHLGECHYHDGNHKAQARAEVITELLEDMGYDPERYALYWMSSAEPELFAKAIRETLSKVRKLDG